MRRWAKGYAASNLDRRLRIERPRSNACAVRRRGSPGTSVPRRRAAELRGSKWLGLGSGRFSAARVIYLGSAGTSSGDSVWRSSPAQAVRATSGLGSGVQRLGVLTRGSSKLGHCLRGALMRSSKLATARPRLHAAASHQRRRSSEGRALGGFGPSLEARGCCGEAHLSVGLSNAGSVWVDFAVAQRRPENGRAATHAIRLGGGQWSFWTGAKRSAGAPGSHL